MKAFVGLLFCAIFINCVYEIASQSTDTKKWWQKASFYQIYPRSFADSDGDGIGDLKGIIAKLDHLKDAGMTACWLSPIFQSPQVDFGYDVSDFYVINREYGNMDDFDNLIAKSNELGIKIMLDFVPNHTSDLHQWFIESEKGNPAYRDYYVWDDGFLNPTFGGKNLPPNNWKSVFGGSAWTWSEARKQFYLHQFTKQQPDLNYRNPKVVEEMSGVLDYYMMKGVAGFRLDAINHMFETKSLPNEPRNEYVTDPDSYEYYVHIHTKDLQETYDIVYDWRAQMDKFAKDNGMDDFVLMTEAYANTSFTMKYYVSDDGTRKGAHMPFNFQLIYNSNRNSDANQIKSGIDEWLNNMPAGETADWVVGSHDHSRAASRSTPDKVDIVNTLVMTLPGASITYYGEEIGMTDYRSFEIKDSRDPNRTPMQWNTAPNAGFSTGKPEDMWLPVNPNYATLNVETQKGMSKSTYKYFQSLTALRKLRTFVDGDINLQIINENVLAYSRLYAGEPGYIVVLNLIETEQIVDLSVFNTFPDGLKVTLAGTNSRFNIGDKTTIKAVTLGAFESIIYTNDGELVEPTTVPTVPTTVPTVSTTVPTQVPSTVMTTTPGGASNVYISIVLLVSVFFLRHLF